jgi:hypothetical protein
MERTGANALTPALNFLQRFVMACETGYDKRVLLALHPRDAESFREA